MEGKEKSMEELIRKNLKELGNVVEKYSQKKQSDKTLGEKVAYNIKRHGGNALAWAGAGFVGGIFLPVIGPLTGAALGAGGYGVVKLYQALKRKKKY